MACPDPAAPADASRDAAGASQAPADASRTATSAGQALADASRAAGTAQPPETGAHAWLDAVRWDDRGLVAAIAQDAASGRVLMVAWMNRQALAETAATGRATYWSRSRGRLWRKGEQSGHVQAVRELRLDCDGDAILLQVEQAGGVACHTGRQSCFFSRFEAGRWQPVDPVLVDPERLYR